MRLEPTLNVTPEGSLTDIPTVVKRETLGMSSETAYMDFPSTQVKAIPKDSERPTTLCGTKEASQAEVLASTRQFFATMEQRNTHIPAEDQRTPTEVRVMDNIEVSGGTNYNNYYNNYFHSYFPKCSGYRSKRYR